MTRKVKDRVKTIVRFIALIIIGGLLLVSQSSHERSEINFEEMDYIGTFPSLDF